MLQQTKEIPGAQTPWPGINQLLAPDERFETRSGFLLAPKQPAQVAALLFIFKQEEIPFSISGRGTSFLSEKSPPLILSSRSFIHLQQHENGVAEAGAGCFLAQLRQFLFENKQETCFEEDPLSHSKRSIGGILLSGRTSGLRLHHESFSESLLGVEFISLDGSLVKWGGPLRSPLAGPAWHKLLLGLKSFPGMIIKAYFKTHPIPASRLRLTWAFDRRDALLIHFEALKSFSSSWEYLDCLQSGNKEEKGFIFAQISGSQPEMEAFSKLCPLFSAALQNGEREQLKKYLQQQSLKVYSSSIDQPLDPGEYFWHQEGDQRGWWLTDKIITESIGQVPLWKERFLQSLSG